MLIIYPLPKVNLQLQNMLQHIQSYTGLSDMGPNSFYEGLERLLTALDTEANLSNIYLSFLSLFITTLLF